MRMTQHAHPQFRYGDGIWMEKRAKQNLSITPTPNSDTGVVSGWYRESETQLRIHFLSDLLKSRVLRPLTWIGWGVCTMETWPLLYY